MLILAGNDSKNSIVHPLVDNVHSSKEYHE